ncbi:MAG: TadE family type IV pilus minor pilin [Arthrobacter sp.]
MPRQRHRQAPCRRDAIPGRGTARARASRLIPGGYGAPNRSEFRAQGKNRGAVTAEFAVALPAVVLLLALLLAGSAAGITQLRLEEAARAGARALARGEDRTAVSGIVRQLAGSSATSSVTAEGEWISLTVSGRVSGPVGSMVPWTLSAKALARGETPESAEVRQPVWVAQLRPPQQAA